MKKLFIFLILLSTVGLYAQDTTSIRMFGVGFSGQYQFFADDSSEMVAMPNPYGRGYAVFQDLNFDAVIVLVDSSDQTEGFREFIALSPFDGVHVPLYFPATGEEYFASADNTPDGRVFAITGNGNQTLPGAIYEIDLLNGTSTFVDTSNVPPGFPRSLEFVPDSGKLFTTEGFFGRVYTMELDTWAQDSLLLDNGSFSVEVHGSYNNGSHMSYSTFAGPFYSMDMSVNLNPAISGPAPVNTVMDFDVLDLISGPDAYNLYPTDFVEIFARYQSNSYQWYRDGSPLAGETFNSIFTNVPGNYQCLYQIDTTDFYMFSEVIAVNAIPEVDTTSNRLVGVNTLQGVNFFRDDTTFWENMGLGNSGLGFAVFNDPDGNLLFLNDDGNFNGNRDIYSLNPFDGSVNLVYDPATTHFASADMTPDGRLFAITGNAVNPPGEIFEIDLANQSDSAVAISNVPAGEPRALEFIPDSNKFFVASGFEGLIYTMELDTWTQGLLGMGPGFSDEVHGMFNQGPSLLYTAFGGEFYTDDLNNGPDPVLTRNFGNTVMDMAEVDMIVEENPGYCPGDSVTLTSRYSSSSQQWYYNGNPIPGATGQTQNAGTTGMYQVLVEISGTGRFVFSEEVEVVEFTSPGVTLMAPSNTICMGDSVLITGSFGGTSQWFLNGNPIAGADTNVYYASEPGSYNMIKTNQSGCSDSAAMAFEVSYFQVNINVEQVGALLKAEATDATFQWIDCGTNMPVDSATDSQFLPTANGAYAVIVTQNGCVDTSECITVDNVGIYQSNFDSHIQMYPNPVQDRLEIDLGQPYQNLTIKLFNTAGQVVMRQNVAIADLVELDVTKLSQGMYLIEIQSSQYRATGKILKQ